MKYTLLVLCALSMQSVFAQDTYRGKVLNTMNSPVESAQVMINDSVAATTDHHGIFEVTLNEPSIAYIYAVGYEVFEAEFNDPEHYYSLTIQPEDDLSELVITPAKEIRSVDKGQRIHRL